MQLEDEKRTPERTKDVAKGKSQQYKNLCKQIKKAAKQDKEHGIQEECEEVEKGLTTGNGRQAFNLIKMLRRKFTLRLNVIRDQETKYYSLRGEITEGWTVYCDNLYKDHEGGDNMARDLKRITSTSTEGPQDILYSKVYRRSDMLTEKNKIPEPNWIIAKMLQAEGK